MALCPDPAVPVPFLLGTSKTSWSELQGCSCLIRASKDGHLEMVQELLSAGADYNAVEKQVCRLPSNFYSCQLYGGHCNIFARPHCAWCNQLNFAEIHVSSLQTIVSLQRILPLSSLTAHALHEPDTCQTHLHKPEKHERLYSMLHTTQLVTGDKHPQGGLCRA